MSGTLPHLFRPLTLRGATLRNRIVLSPMGQYSAVEGHVQDWHRAHHARFAAAGLGLAMVEATAVTRDGRITHGCTGIWEHAQVTGLAALAALHHANGGKAGLQIAHAGRRCAAERPWDGAGPIPRTTGPEAAWEKVGPSAIPEQPGHPVPRALSGAEIEGIIAAFAAAAGRALRAGFDVLEIHGGHGYLIHSFLSPISNQRTDAWGGSRENRMRLALEVTRAVRRVWPADRPLFFRVSAADGAEGGSPLADTVALALELGLLGVDVVDCSAGGMGGPAPGARIRPGYLVPNARAVRQGAGVATMAVGAIIAPSQAEAVIAEGSADLVALGRQLLAEPHWPCRAAVELGHPDPSSVLPDRYAFYLRRRAAVLDTGGPA